MYAFPKMSRGSESGPTIKTLTAADFRVFEDGKEQKILNITLQLDLTVVEIHDNVGSHYERSNAPRGKWRYPEIEQGWRTLPENFYLIAYSPPESVEGSCHRIQVKVDRPNSVVYARQEYCNVKHSSSDPLSGTKFGEELEHDLVSDLRAKIPLSFQTAIFYADNTTARVRIVVKFPWDTLKAEWRTEWGLLHFYATTGILGIATRRDGTVAARFSDLAPGGSADTPNFIWGDPLDVSAANEFRRVNMPTAYETQIDLPPGEYHLKIVLSDGSKFGLIETPIMIDGYDRNQLGISSVAISKRFREVANAPKLDDGTIVNLAPELVPLVSKGIVFTPAADTGFKKGEPLFAYFEVYEPLLAGAPATTVQTRLKITNAKTDELKVDTGLRSAAAWITPGKTVIPIAEQIAVDKLPPGSYKLEVQATDSAGKSAVWRAASFTVD